MRTWSTIGATWYLGEPMLRKNAQAFSAWGASEGCSMVVCDGWTWLTEIAMHTKCLSALRPRKPRVQGMPTVSDAARLSPSGMPHQAENVEGCHGANSLLIIANSPATTPLVVRRDTLAFPTTPPVPQQLPICTVEKYRVF